MTLVKSSEKKLKSHSMIRGERERSRENIKYFDSSHQTIDSIHVVLNVWLNWFLFILVWKTIQTVFFVVVTGFCVGCFNSISISYVAYKKSVTKFHILCFVLLLLVIPSFHFIQFQFIPVALIKSQSYGMRLCTWHHLKKSFL